MRKPLKKPAHTLKTPTKPKRPTDPNLAAHAILSDHMSRIQDAPPPPPKPPLDFETQYKAHMSKLGAKGGKASGAKRMSMPEEQRRNIALKAARARWARRNN